MQILPFQALYLNPELVTSPDLFCEEAKFQFSEYKESGFYRKSPSDSLFVYQIKDKTKSTKGIIAALPVEEFLEGRIKKHEKTLNAKEQQQFQLFLKHEAVIKPVLLTYEPTQAINEIMAKTMTKAPFLNIQFEKGGEEHTLWEISEGKDIEELCSAFQNVPSTYIADGHHRTSTIAHMKDRMPEIRPSLGFKNLFCALFSSEDLLILEYNRVIDGLNDLSPATFMAKISHFFNIEVLKKDKSPKAKGIITMLLNKEWFRLTWKKEVLASHSPNGFFLDASVLNELVLDKILGISDVRTDPRVLYVEGTKGTDGIRKECNKGEERVGFALYPVAFEDMKHLSDQGETLPPKSTWFEPRMKSGLLAMEL
jgi:uncharacterized protein (DUF1015 family)